MTVHQLWRFPIDATELASLRGDGGSASACTSCVKTNASSNFIPGIENLSDQEFILARDLICKYHMHAAGPNQCHSVLIQRISAPVDLVWSVVRRFDNPQEYKHFIKRCSVKGDGNVGSTREVEIISGLPAISSTERLEILDEERHIIGFKVLGGQHRLRNYCSVTTLHVSENDGKPCTVVIESYMVDIPDGNSWEDTRTFADTIVRYNLASLGRLSELRNSCGQEEERPCIGMQDEADHLQLSSGS